MPNHPISPKFNIIAEVSGIIDNKPNFHERKNIHVIDNMIRIDKIKNGQKLKYFNTDSLINNESSNESLILSLRIIS